MTHKVTNLIGDNGPGPDVPAPQDEHEKKRCEGTIVLECECCHMRLVSQTMIIETGPMSVPDLAAYLAQATSNYEQQGYIILAHSLLDAGGGWIVGLTVAWYQ